MDDVSTVISDRKGAADVVSLADHLNEAAKAAVRLGKIDLARRLVDIAARECKAILGAA